MSKSIFSFALTVAIAVASQAVAADGVPSDDALSTMGLAGMEVVSDSDALAIRGKGYMGHGTHDVWTVLGASAYGHSWANITNPMGDAGTDDGFDAFGNFSAGGKHFSEAGKEIVTMEIVEIDGGIKKHTTTEAVRVFAGGFAESMRL